MLITGDLGFGVVDRFAEQFPKQFINAGVAEQNMTGLACGLALEGHKVFTYSIANFTTLRCLEQLRNDVCYHGADVTAVAVGGGFSYGQLGMSHFATEDLAILRALPEMKVIAPTGIWEAEGATRALIAGRGPAYLRLDKGRAASEGAAGEQFVLGKSRRLRDGTDVCFIATGAILSEALKATDLLADAGFSARVISMHTIKPIDGDAIVAAARECGGLVTMEEHTRLGGLGSAVGEICLQAQAVPAFFLSVGLDDLFPSIVGDQEYLRRQYGMTAEATLSRILPLLRSHRS